MENDHRDRRKRQILRRVRQHKLLTTQNKTYQFSDLSPELIKAIAPFISEEKEPLLIFLETPLHWTVLGTTFIYSKYGDAFAKARLSSIQGKVSMIHPKSANVEIDSSLKFELTFIALDNAKVNIWAPSGKEYFALVNILKHTC